MNRENTDPNSRAFFLPVNRRLPEKQSYQCRHCGAKYYEEYATEYCWPDRAKGENRGLVVTCRKCGCRQQIFMGAQPDHSSDMLRYGQHAVQMGRHGERSDIQPGNGSGKTQTVRKMPLVRILAALLGFSFLVMLVIALLFWRNANQKANSTLGFGNSQEEDRIADTTEEQEQATIDEVNPSEAEAEEQNETEYYSSAYADYHGYYGNSFENISQGGLMVSVGEWLYYTNTNSDNTVWKMKHDGTGKEQVLDVPAWHMSVYKGWLYYREYSSRGYLCRYNLQENRNEILVKRNVYEPKIVGRYIYYGDQSDKSFDLYRIDIDGNHETKLTDGIVLYCCVTDQRIYYLDTAVDRKGYSTNLDGNDKQLWYAGRVGTIDYYDGLIYFTDADEGGLFTLNPKDNSVEKISDLTMWSINVYNGWIYYADGKNNSALTRTSLTDANKKEELCGDSCELVNVSGGWIQFHIKGEDNKKDYYWIPIEGGEIKQF